MDDDNWDLHAVVKSCCRASPSSSHGGRDLPRDQIHSSPPLTSPRTLHNAFHELEEVCRPYFVAPTKHMLDVRSLSSPAPRQMPLGHVPARSKRRKSQMKRVVCEVPADGVCSDVWAWRKYGQKPIKGSPFPRGYYKCSSSKGCPARKLVERSRTDPGTISVTYMGEHNHAAPAHRNCLAGSTRNTKQPVTSSPPSNTSDAIVGGLSPTTPLTATAEEEMEMFVGLGEELDDEIMDFVLL